MKRRRFIVASTAALALPSIARGAKTSVLKFIPSVDLSSVDPVASPSYVTRSHGLMVFDTLYGQAGIDRDFSVQPQMVAGHAVEDGGRLWSLTLRDGLLFHDGTRVLARDCVASIRRWAVRDLFGQSLMQRTDELRATDDRTIQFRLNKPFNLLPDALGKFGYFICAIMPERLAKTDPFKQIPEVVGSGPFRFKQDEGKPGSIYVYERFESYRPREAGQTNFVSGPKIAHFDRAEWHINPDPNSATEALQTGEVDWIEYALGDLRAVLQRDKNLRLQKVGSTGFWGSLRMNQLYPPFSNPAIRRALMGGIDQTEYMMALSSDPSTWRVPTGFFPLGSPMATDEGLTVLTGPRDLGKVRENLRSAGYQGEKVVLLSEPGVGAIKVFADITADLLRKIGMNVDEQVLDPGTWVQRLFSKKPPNEGGWNIYCVTLQGTDALTPATARYLRGNGEQAAAGWPNSAKLEALHEAWLDAPDVASQRLIAREIQAQAFIDVPYCPLGTSFFETAYSSDLAGVLDGQAIFWNVRREV
jgi:peptide/nickel transport system substrate-binding protein